jgi:hypothetical protein
MKRREFLFRAAAGFTGVFVLTVSAPGCDRIEIPVDVTKILPANAARIGKAWLDQSESRPDKNSLVEALFADEDWSGADGPEVLRRLAAKVKSDFQAGRTAHPSGWVLSITEVRLAALVHWEARQAKAEAQKPSNRKPATPEGK